MERTEITAKKGYKLTQVAEVEITERVYVSRVYTLTPEDWRQAPDKEAAEWRKEIEKLNEENI